MREDNIILEMLTYRRKAGTKGEEQFIERFIDSVPGMRVDDYGNRYIVVGEGNPTTMFSAHTDTVHNGPGMRQGVLFDPHTGDAFLSGKAKANKMRRDVLGADDAAGCYVLLELIAEGIPGLYVFHREEEIGGIGSNHFAKVNEFGLLSTVQRCIAFDRKGFSSVITAQAGEYCCSSEFASALAVKLGHAWKADDTGVFTDSANYTDIVPECTNLSVGYNDEHTGKETLNIGFLEDLIDTLCDIEWDTLPTKRDPSKPQWLDYQYGNASFGWPSGNVKMQDVYQPTTWDHYGKTFGNWEQAYAYVCAHPEEAADLLLAYCGDSDRREA